MFDIALDPEVPATKGRSRLARAPFGLVFLGIWLACGAVGALLVFAVDYPNQRQYTQLDNHGTVVMAEVTRTEPMNHNTVYYTFVHGSTRYSSSDSSDSPNPEASELAPGDLIHVVYDPRDPNVSCACDPHASRVPAQWWRVSIAGLILGSVIAVVISASIQRWRDG